MANVSHASLTGSQLHEPKGVDTASLGEVYIADGAGSGAWGDVGTASFTGMIADFVTPFPPSGWLECNGAVISSTTYSALYNVMTYSQNGSRINGSPIITGMDPTLSSGVGIGYYIFGTGIPAGTTIISQDSSTQITMSANATSTGTGTVIISPWLLGSGTIKLPDVKTDARYRRSRGGSNIIGATQADTNKTHTHTLSVSGTTSSNGSHTHTVTDPGHGHTIDVGSSGAGTTQVTQGAPGIGATVSDPVNTNTTGISLVAGGAHTHTVTSTGTSGSSGSTEARPLTLVVMTCVKT